MNAPRIYLAGPEVFLADARAIADAKRDLCARYGFIGVSPVDNELNVAGLPKREAALRIAATNEDAIRSSNLLIANLTPFRGPSADVGTAYELGFAVALGLPTFGYSNAPGSLLERTRKEFGGIRQRPTGEFEDADGMVIEDFGCFDNLMLVGALADRAQVVANAVPAAHRFTNLNAFEACLRMAAKEFGAGGIVRVQTR
jgi:nucleoside 2-deoxyribosyltransferase